jgi:hypothetical protein
MAVVVDRSRSDSARSPFGRPIPWARPSAPLDHPPVAWRTRISRGFAALGSVFFHPPASLASPSTHDLTPPAREAAVQILQRLYRLPTQGYTTVELAEELGVPRPVVIAALHWLQRVGEVQPGGRRSGVAGSWTARPVPPNP